VVSDDTIDEIKFAVVIHLTRDEIAHQRHALQEDSGRVTAIQLLR